MIKLAVITVNEDEARIIRKVFDNSLDNGLILESRRNSFIQLRDKFADLKYKKSILGNKLVP